MVSYSSVIAPSDFFPINMKGVMYKNSAYTSLEREVCKSLHCKKNSTHCYYKLALEISKAAVLLGKYVRIILGDFECQRTNLIRHIVEYGVRGRLPLLRIEITILA